MRGYRSEGTKKNILWSKTEGGRNDKKRKEMKVEESYRLLVLEYGIYKRRENYTDNIVPSNHSVSTWHPRSLFIPQIGKPTGRRVRTLQVASFIPTRFQTERGKAGPSANRPNKRTKPNRLSFPIFSPTQFIRISHLRYILTNSALSLPPSVLAASKRFLKRLLSHTAQIQGKGPKFRSMQ